MPNKTGRREFLRIGSHAAAAISLLRNNSGQASVTRDGGAGSTATNEQSNGFNGIYTGERLDHISYPMGGIGAGMICLDGAGALSHVSIRNRPELYNEPCTFAAISIKGQTRVSRVIEGPVPPQKIFGLPKSGLGTPGATYGLPRFRDASFSARFPFGTVSLIDPGVPVTAEITGWSPFVPGDAKNSGLPVAAIEYTFSNKTAQEIEAVFSFNTNNFLATDDCPTAVRPLEQGFILWNGGTPEKPWQEASLSAVLLNPGTRVNHRWFRGQWWDAFTLAWRDVEQAACYDAPPLNEGTPSPGASIFCPLQIGPHDSRSVTLLLAWYSPFTELRLGADRENSQDRNKETYRPWYSGQFANIEEIAKYWRANYPELRKKTRQFTDCFYNTTLPAEVTEAVAANLSILKSPTVLRQVDGKLWAWEGCEDDNGSCGGSCTHVWNYAQSISHLFPELERTLRETEFGPSQDEKGHQIFRSALPIRPVAHTFYAAADGQLGGILKVYREWRISGDNTWLRSIWKKVKLSLRYCIETWDPRHTGLIEEPHHNTYDIEFWGPEPMCSSMYLGALQAAISMSRAMNDSSSLYEQLLQKGSRRMESDLFNGQFFFQDVKTDGLRATLPTHTFGGEPYSHEALQLIEKEGPNYQYGNGCLSDGVIGAWMSFVCGVAPTIDVQKTLSHLRSVHKNNLKSDLSTSANPQRPTFALGTEGGLLLCSWPEGNKPSLPFIYSNEVWTGIEYQVASHMIHVGLVKEGLEIVRKCRERYDGNVRNPFDEYECGHWYARAMSSYALLEAFSGARYDAVEKTLYLNPRMSGDFRSFLATASGFGTIGVKDGQPFIDVVYGDIPYRQFKYTPAVSQAS